MTVPPSTHSARLCPKCGKKRADELQGDAESCPRCGLVFALWKEDGSVALATLDSAGEDLWRRVQEDWSNSARHEEFLKHCLQSDTLAAAGRLYRERLDENPKDAVAAQMQSQILSKAALALSIHKSQPREPVTRNRWFWVVILVAMAVGIAGGLFWRKFR
jgi:ribosomal protein S27AE